MRKITLLLLAFGLFSLSSYAQVANYAFSQATATFDTLGGGKILGTGTTAAGTYFSDSTVSAGSITVNSGIGLPIGFTFKFNNTNYDVFGVNVNGWIAFGQSSLTPSVNMINSSVANPISATSSAAATLQNRVSAFGRGIVAQTISRLSYATIGTAPNRTLVVEWRNFKRSTGGSVDTLSFQIRLSETTNLVEVVYGTMKVSGNSSGQVGLRGQTNTDYNNRTTTTNWSASTAGTANNATMTISTTVLPVLGLTFVWTPPVVYQFDAGLTAINAPGTPVTIGNNNITVTIKNFGTDSLKTATIAWKVNNVLQTPYPFSNVGLPQFATNGPITLGSYNFSTSGAYTIKAWTSLPNGNTDGNHTNDTLVKTVFAQAYASIPFIETFDNTWVNKNDTNDVPTTYWSNTPAFGNNSWRRDDDTISGNWTQGYGGVYSPAGANATAHSARFHTWMAANNTNGIMDLYVDLTPAGSKLLDFWYLNTSGNDSLSVYLSTNGGTSFSFVKKLTVATAWKRNIINIGSSTSANCVIRFRAVSDYGQTDLGIDQAQVYLLPANDIAATKWISPTSGCGMTTTEHVTVKITNMGAAAQSNIPVKYSINGGTSYVGPETLPGPVNPGDTALYTFTATSNFAAAGQYACKIVVLNPGDALSVNDTSNVNIYSSNVISTIPFVENFNSGYSNYFILSTNADANVYYDTTGTQGTIGLHFTGKTTNQWNSGTTSSVAAWSHTTHQATAVSCGVNATSVTTLAMKFDLRETTSSNNNYTYTWYAAVVNGTDTIADNTGRKFFNPVSMNDAYATKYFNLTPYAGTNFTLKFVSACRRDVANSTNGIGDNVFFDNLALYVPPVMNDLGHDTSICDGSTITYDAGSGTGYTYVWTQQPAGDTLGYAQTYTVSASGTYQVVVTNNMGFSVADAVTVTVMPAPAANAGNDTTVVYLDAATLHGSVGNPGNYSYSWAPADSLVNATLQNPVTKPMHSSQIFTLTVTNNTTGCVGTDQVIVYVTGGPLTITAYATPDTICSGEAVSLQALPSGGSGNYTFDWTSVPAGFTSTGINSVDYPLVNTVYNLRLADATLEDTVYTSVAVVVHPVPVVSLGNDTTLCTINTITLHSGVAATYLWSTGETTQSIVVDSADATGGIAHITCTATNVYGCAKTDAIDITFVSCSGINEYGNDAVIAMYPNPTTGLTNIKVDGLNGRANLNIYNLQGQRVYSGSMEGSSLTTIELSGLSKGVYLVKIQNEQRSLINKLIIQ